ncbi:hypothetical protein AHF37_11897 [Paragonimus kellicotti]|nr:hypothetical protein AHF37_11897 [Paragonimus kellicotti]
MNWFIPFFYLLLCHWDTKAYIWKSENKQLRIEYCRLIWWKFVNTCPSRVNIGSEDFLKKIPWRPMA